MRVTRSRQAQTLRASLAGVGPLDHLALVGIVRDANTIKNYNIASATELAVTKTVGYPKDDVRRIAARNALLWQIFSSTRAAVAEDGIVAVASLVILSIQTGRIAQQNRYFREPNKAIQAHIEQQASEERDRRRTEVITGIYALKDGPYQGAGIPVADARTRIEAFREFVALERSRLRAWRKAGTHSYPTGKALKKPETFISGLYELAPRAEL